jgi:hypothetical protein
MICLNNELPPFLPCLSELVTILRPQKEVPWVVGMSTSKLAPLCVLLYSPPANVSQSESQVTVEGYYYSYLCRDRLDDWRGVQRNVLEGVSITVQASCG